MKKRILYCSLPSFIILLMLNSCGTTSQIPLASEKTTEEKSFSNETSLSSKETQTQQDNLNDFENSPTEETYLNTESQNNADEQNFLKEDSPNEEAILSKEEPTPEEIVDTEDILSDTFSFEENEPFTEPDVFDAPLQEEITLVENQNYFTENDANSTEETEEKSKDFFDNRPSLTAQSADFQDNQTQVLNGTGENSQQKNDSQKNVNSAQTKPSVAVNVHSNKSSTPKTDSKNDKNSESKNNSLKDENSLQDKESESQNDSSVDVFKNPSVIIPSRSMRVKNNQYLDVIYPGNGWIYIGETGKTPLFRYFGRMLGNSDTKFTLRSMKSGKTYLHFYKNDVLTASYIDDYLEVDVIEENAVSTEKATAPSYAEVVPPKPVRAVTEILLDSENTEKNSNTTAEKNSENDYSKAKKSSSEVESNQKREENPNSDSNSSENSTPIDDKKVKTVIQNKDSKNTGEENTILQQISEPTTTVFAQEKTDKTSTKSSNSLAEINLDPTKSLLEQAKQSLSEKKYELALAQIQAYMDSSSENFDEALYVQGQILEADSPIRNIKSALDSYDTLIKRYPASKYWSNANKRKIFLNRFYINIF